MKNKIMLVFVLLFTALLCFNFTACGGPGNSGGGGSAFKQFEKTVTDSQNAFAQIVNGISDEPVSGSDENGDKDAKFALSLGNVLAQDEMLSAIGNAVRENKTYKGSYSHTVGLWKNTLPETILNMQLKALVYARIADSVNVDFLSNTMNYRNDGCYAIGKIDDGYVIEVTDDANDTNRDVSFFEMVSFSGSTAEDVGFCRISFNFNENGDPNRLEFVCLKRSVYYEVRIGCDADGGVFSKNPGESLGGTMTLSSLEEMRTYICSLDSAKPKDEKPEDGETDYEEASDEYYALSNIFTDCRDRIIRAFGLTGADVLSRAAGMRSQCKDMDEITGMENGDFGENVYEYMDEYRTAFYENFSFKPVVEDFYVENGVLKEYLGWQDIVTIPDGVVKIANSCSLHGRKLIIPESLREIEPSDRISYNMAEIYGFEEIEFSGENPNFYVDGALVCDANGKPLFLVNNGLLESVDYDVISAEYLRNYAHMAMKLKDESFNNPDFIYGVIASVREISMDAALFSEGFENYYPNLERIVVRENSSVKELEFTIGGAYENLDEIVLPDNLTSLAVHYLIDSVASFNIPSKLQYFSIESETLTELEVPEGVIELRIDLPALERLVLPQGVSFASVNAPLVTELTIPDTLTEWNFYLPKLRSVVFTGRRERIDAFIEQSWEIGSPLNPLEEIVFPEGLTVIGPNTFRNTSFTSIAFPDTLVRIEEGAFESCTVLSEIILPESLEYIGLSSFRGCSSLQSVDLCGVKEISGHAFAQCSSLGEVKLSSELDIIGRNAFSECRALTEIEIPEGTEVIGEYAFLDTSVRAITIPSTVREIGRQTFSVELENLTFVESENELSVTISDTRIKNCTVSSNITYFDASGVETLTVYGTPKLWLYDVRNLILMDVFEIDYDDFVSSTNSIIPSDTNVSFAECTEYYTVTYINDDGSVVRADEVLEGTRYSVTGSAQSSIPATVSEMYRFVGWSLNGEDVTGKSMIIRGDVSFTAEYEVVQTFRYESCEGGVCVLGYTDTAFDPLTVEIPETIGGSTVKKIAPGAFSQCTSLTKLIIPFTGTADGGSLYEIFGRYGSVPESLREVVVTASAKAGGFVGCGKIEKITYNATVTETPENAFSGCSSLSELNIPDNRSAVIGSNAFLDTALTSYDIPAETRRIGINPFPEKMVVNYEGSISQWVTITFDWDSSNPAFYTKELRIGGNVVSEAVIPEGVTQISSYAFAHCESLVSVVVPDSVTSFGKGVFYGCTSLESLSVPFIGAEAGGTEYTNLGYLFGYNNYNGFYVSYNSNVPETFKRITVTGAAPIAAQALSECKYITEIVVTENVTAIGGRAFYRCDSLQKITLPYLGNSATGDVSSRFNYIFNDEAEPLGYGIPTTLTEVALTGGTSLGYRAFYYCNNLETIRLPQGITSIGVEAFSSCVPSALYYGGSLEEWLSIDFKGTESNPLDHNGSTKETDLFFEGNLLEGDLVIPESITVIPDYAFCGNKSITSLTIHENVTSIGKKAFYDCYNIREIDYNARYAVADCSNASDCSFNHGAYSAEVKLCIGSAVREITDELFRHLCATEIEFAPDGVCERIGDYALTSSQVSTVSLPSTLRQIGNGAFYSSDKLAELVIPESVESIGADAFSSCYALKKLVIHPGLNEEGDIGSGAFFAANNIEELEATVYAAKFVSLGKVRTLTLTGGTTIDSYFNDCYALETLTIPETVTSIDCWFSASVNLSVVNFNAVECTSNGFKGGAESDKLVLRIGPSVKSISNGMFCESNVTNVIFDEKCVCTSIGESAFASCSRLASITLSNKITRIGSAAFGGDGALGEIRYLGSVADWCGEMEGRESLMYKTLDLYIDGLPAEDIVIPEGVTSISDYAFRYCNKVRTVSVPDSVTYLGDGAFMGCENLTEINLPDGLTYIGYVAFFQCVSLTGITVPLDVTFVGRNAFASCTALVKIDFNAAHYPENESSDGWFAKAGQSGEGIDVTFGKDVTYIPSYLLSDEDDYDRFPKIKTVTFAPDSVCETLGDCVFYGCSEVREILLPESVQRVGKGIFTGCDNLQKVSIPYVGENPDGSGNGKFEYHFYKDGYNCGIPKYLITITVTGGTYIADRAFEGCVALRNLYLPASITGAGDEIFYRCLNMDTLFVPVCLVPKLKESLYSLIRVIHVIGDGELTVSMIDEFMFFHNLEFIILQVDKICGDTDNDCILNSSCVYIGEGVSYIGPNVLGHGNTEFADFDGWTVYESESDETGIQLDMTAENQASLQTQYKSYIWRKTKTE
ncbi:MAG: leucine-rich repeat protein [Christensenellales bacterium]